MNYNFFIFSLLVLITGCASEPRLPEFVSPVSIAQPEPVLVGLDEEERFSQLEAIRNEPVKEFRLGKGDVLRVSVYDESDLTLDAIPVRPDGRISFPLIGEVLAEGFTADEIRADMTDRLSQFLVDPKVSVVVQHYKSQQYTIVGQVVNPGAYALDTNVMLTQALAMAGGLNTGNFHATTVELADLQHSFIARNGEMLPIDFVALFRGGDLRYDIPLRAGDYIYIPSGLSQEIYVLGEVKNADMFAFKEGMSLTKALVISRGFTRLADTDRVHLIRGSLTDPELYVVDLDDIYDGRVRDVYLEPGDIVFVPRTGLSNWSQIVNQILPSFTLAGTGTAF